MGTVSTTWAQCLQHGHSVWALNQFLGHFVPMCQHGVLWSSKSDGRTPPPVRLAIYYTTTQVEWTLQPHLHVAVGWLKVPILAFCTIYLGKFGKKCLSGFRMNMEFGGKPLEWSG